MFHHKLKIEKIIEVLVFSNLITSNIYMLYKYMPLPQIDPENPSGHAVHKFSSITSQAVHVPLQAEKDAFLSGFLMFNNYNIC